MNFARIVNDVAVDVTPRPNAVFPPEIASLFTPVPDEVQPGWVKLPVIVNGKVTGAKSWHPPGTEIVQVNGDSVYNARPSKPRPVFVDRKPVPKAVSMAQGRIAMARAGITEAMVDAVIAGLPDGDLKTEARIWWERSNEIWRRSATVAALAPLLGLTDKQVDDLFIAAREVEP